MLNMHIYIRYVFNSHIYQAPNHLCHDTSPLHHPSLYSDASIFQKSSKIIYRDLFQGLPLGQNEDHKFFK